jgi:hypothetical protein
MKLIELNTNPSRRELRWFAGLWFPLFAALAGVVVWHVAQSLQWAMMVWTVTGGLSLLGWLIPAIIKPVFVGLIFLTFPIGWVLSHIVMAVIYYGLFTAFGLGMRIIRFDPMQRQFDRHAGSYWVKLPPPPSKPQYFRQF